MTENADYSNWKVEISKRGTEQKSGHRALCLDVEARMNRFIIAQEKGQTENDSGGWRALATRRSGVRY